MKTKNVKLLLSAAIVLLMAWALASCSKSKDVAATPVTKDALKAEVAVANNLLSTTTEGTGNGEFAKGSQSTLSDAVTAANNVVTDAGATQLVINATLAQLTAAVATYNGSVVVPIAPDALVGQWTFDELTSAAVGTSVKDHSGKANDGAITAGAAYFSTAAGLPYADYVVTSNVPTQVADRYGDANKALHFAAGANVQIPYSTTLNPGVITITLWVKPDSLKKYWANNYMVSMNRWNGFKFQIQDTPREFLTVHVAGKNSPAKGDGSDSTIYDRDMNTGAIKPLTAWYHLAVTFGGGHEVFYINGVQVYDWGSVPAEALPGTIVNLNAKTSTIISPVDLVIGQDLPTSKYSSDSNSPFYVNYGAYFIGAMDEVRIYNTVLTGAQITSIYNQEKP